MKTIEISADSLEKLLTEWKAIARTAFRDANDDQGRGDMYAARAIRMKAFAYRHCAQALEQLIPSSTVHLPTEAAAETTTTPRLS